MALTRSSIVRGPGMFYWGSDNPVALPSIDGINAEVDVKTIDVKTDAEGTIARRRVDVMARITQTPLGLMTQAILDILYPAAYRNPVRGTSIFGAADQPCIVHSKAGQKILFKSAALTKMPPMMLSATKPLFGGMEVMAIRRNGVEWSESDALFVRTAEAYAAPTFDSADVVNQPYTGAWGAYLPSIVSEAGWTVEPTIGTQPDAIDAYGTNDEILDSAACVARCTPKNLSEAMLDELQLQGAGVAIGMDERRADLVLTGTKLVVSLYDATFLKGPCRWKGTEIRAGEIAFGASRQETNGVYGPIWGFTLPA